MVAIKTNLRELKALNELYCAQYKLANAPDDAICYLDAEYDAQNNIKFIVPSMPEKKIGFWQKVMGKK
jgi:hypothetical protein